MINKKEIKKQYKQTLLPVGIYQVKNKVSGKIFIGSGKNLPGNINRNKFQLKNGLHINLELQKDYSEFGEDNFTFEVLDYLDIKDAPDSDYTEDLNTLEEMWLEKLQPYEENGYNKRKHK